VAVVSARPYMAVMRLGEERSKPHSGHDTNRGRLWNVAFCGVAAERPASALPFTMFPLCGHVIVR
jgi:hypothetical protein